MTQKYKAVYFPEHPGNTSQKKSLTLAFGKKLMSSMNASRGFPVLNSVSCLAMTIKHLWRKLRQMTYH